METTELKKIWQTLANEKLIDEGLAKENIERIIANKSSKNVEALSRKLKTDFYWAVIASVSILLITLFATIFLQQRNHPLPVEGYIFLVMCMGFYCTKALQTNSRMKLIGLSFNTSSILDSLEKVKQGFTKNMKQEALFTNLALAILTVFANVQINSQTTLSNFRINSLQGYVLIFSVLYLGSLPWIGKLIYKKRFSGILNEIDQSIQELVSEK